MSGPCNDPNCETCRRMSTPEERAAQDTLAQEALERRVRRVQFQARASEDARKLKLSTRTSRLALLKRAAEKRARKGVKRRLDAYAQ
jgi:hypothetical protein